MRTGCRARTWTGLAVILISLGFAVGAGTRAAREMDGPAKGPQTVISVQVTDYDRQLRELVDAGFEVIGVDYDAKIIDVLVDARSKGMLEGFMGEKDGLPISVLEERVVPTAVDPGYRTPEEVETFVKQIASESPDITQLVSIGKSLEGRDIWAIKVTSNPTVEDPTKPVVLFNSMHHAREVMTTEVALDTLQYLTFNYGTDQKVRRWVDENVIWIIPMLNVDGSNKVWTANPMWRKNARGGYGVVINRNYPYRWNECNGSSGNRNADDFRGDSAGSEPETQVMMAFARRIRPVLSISYHSYSELVLYPYSCQGARVPTREVVEGIGQQMARLLPSDGTAGTFYKPGTPWDILYAVDGGDIDWLYNELRVIPYVIEISARAQGFQPSYALWRDRTVTKMRAAWGFILDRAAGPGVRAIVRNAGGAAVSAGSVLIEREGMAADTLPILPNGSFHAVLNPGTYKFTISAPGVQPQVRTVTVGDTRVNLAVTL